jgi:hypothetical protein
MKIYQLTKIGEHHVNHCEDYTITENLGTDKLLCAVMDGCTMGTDSYLASTLTGKLLRKIAIERSFRSFHEKTASPDCKTEVKEVLRSLIKELRTIKNQLFLNADELLTTLVLAVFDLRKQEGFILTVGDGLICVNGSLIEYQQNNTPDYLGYHLTEDFETWFSVQHQTMAVTTLYDISLSTDGIFTFSPYNENTFEVTVDDPINYLLVNSTDSDMPNMLLKKATFLDRSCGLRPTDDLGIIRIQF